MDTSLEAPAPDETSSRDGLFAISIAVALLALLGAVIAVGLGWRAIDESEATGAGGGGGEEAGQAMVTLSESR